MNPGLESSQRCSLLNHDGLKGLPLDVDRYGLVGKLHRVGDILLGKVENLDCDGFIGIPESGGHEGLSWEMQQTTIETF
jgi:hypothetical protein